MDEQEIKDKYFKLSKSLLSLPSNLNEEILQKYVKIIEELNLIDYKPKFLTDLVSSCIIAI